MMGTMRRRLICIFAAAAFALSAMPQIRAVAQLPGMMVMHSGAEVVIPASNMLDASLDDAGNGIAEIETRAGEPAKLAALGEGQASLTYRLLGVLPVRTVGVSVEPERMLIPGGQSVGIAIDTDGVVVVGSSDIGRTASPARLAGIKAGDVIRRVNGTAIESAEAMSDAIASGDTVNLVILRNGEEIACQVTPVRDNRDGRWRLGAWVRDSTAGIGTLTFSEAESGRFGALGHAITDVDTNVAMPVGMGELYENNVVDVTPSENGAPGEMTGDFIFDAKPIGEVRLNSDRGVFGVMEQLPADSHYPNGLPAARRGEIHTGPATLLTTVDESGVKEYDCEIVRLNERTDAATRSMVVRITDPELIARTGGIVQGMSGSPLIQDGRLIGAVTHVMVNDPTMGYGISIEAMLEQADQLEAGTYTEEPLAA